MASTTKHTGERHAELRRVSCLFFTLEDVYVIFCLVIALAGLVMSLLEALNAFDHSTWCRVYLSSVLGSSSLLALLQAVPSWRVRSCSPHLLGAIGLLNLASALGFGFGSIWDHNAVNEGGDDLPEIGLPELDFPEIRPVDNPAGEAVVKLARAVIGNFHVPEDLPNYVEAFVFLGSIGLCMSGVAALHEFGLKRASYPRKEPCKYLTFLSIVGCSAIWCYALAVLTVNPDLAQQSQIFGKTLTMPAEDKWIRVVMGTSRFAAGCLISLLFIRKRPVAYIVRIGCLLAGVWHVALSVFSFVDMKFLQPFASSTSTFAGAMFISSAVAIFAAVAAAQCLAPSLKEPTKLSSRKDSLKGQRGSSLEGQRRRRRRDEGDDRHRSADSTRAGGAPPPSSRGGNVQIPLSSRGTTRSGSGGWRSSPSPVAVKAWSSGSSDHSITGSGLQV